ncbi:hypothetical protein GW17_00018663 [Ensete ventricosum]|nr:hypothetical protein GW17_00018663 [Ensete ventricosum]
MLQSLTSKPLSMASGASAFFLYPLSNDSFYDCLSMTAILFCQLSHSSVETSLCMRSPSSCTTTDAYQSRRLLSSCNTYCHTVAPLFLTCNPASSACHPPACLKQVQRHVQSRWLQPPSLVTTAALVGPSCGPSRPQSWPSPSAPIRSCCYLSASPRQRTISATVPSAARSAAFVTKPSSSAASTSSISSSLYRSRASAAIAAADGSSYSNHCFHCILL